MPFSRSESSGRTKPKSRRASRAGGRQSRGADDAAASPPPELRELIAISRAVGADPDLVQGGGGNTSVKSRDGRRLYVKASGTALADMDERRGWAALDLEATRAVLEVPGLGRLGAKRREAEVLRRLASAVIEPSGARPSVEASLHALLDRVVIHTHPVGLGALLSSKLSAERLPRLLKGIAGAAPLYVPYTDPGYTLAARLEREIRAWVEERGRRPSVVLLENHGVFVAAPSVRASLDLHRRVTDVGRRWIGGGRVQPESVSDVVAPEPSGAGSGGSTKTPSLLEVRGALLQGGAAPGVLRRDPTPWARRLVEDADRVAAIRRGGAFTPDQIVYCRTWPLVLAGRPSTWARAARAWRKKRGCDPRVVIVPGAGVYHYAPDLGQLRVVSDTFRAAIVTLLRSSRAGGPRFLTRRQARFIEEWEVESYRARLLAGGAAPLTGRVAVVTGAGSGLGRGIALGILEAGGTIAGLDIDRAALEEAAAAAPAGRFLPIPCDVTDEESVRAAFASAVASAGGIDFLVNAAGIAPAFPLVDFPLGAWRKTLEINLTGYFLCAREAARILLRQGAGGSIVNLTSKSGLEASRENSAYNATKAGEIHLMRGWALELGRAGVRVNCVAPGNVFKGSKIWNEEYIRVCARKRGIRPEEVIPYYTSLSPLGEEIEPGDVAGAVVFLLSQAARRITGQVIVVDGGQVMVR